MAIHSNSLTNVNRKTTVGSKLRAQFKKCKNVVIECIVYKSKLSMMEMTSDQLGKFLNSKYESKRPNSRQ